MKKLSIGLLVFTSAVLFSCATTSKTSEIPDRREFPVDNSVNACNNFFKHACGPAIDAFKLREDRSRHIFSFNDSYERVLNAKKKYLKDLQSQKTFNKKSQQLHDYYASCTDQSARTAEEKTVLKNAVSKMNAIKTKKEFANFLTQQSLKGLDSHISYGNIANLDNSDIYDFIMMPALMASLPEKSYYANKELMVEFKSIATDFFKLAG